MSIIMRLHNSIDIINKQLKRHFSYQLLDGTRREENAFITGLRMDNYSRLDSKTTDFTAVGVGGRPKMPLKNRKLSPGALKSLSG